MKPAAFRLARPTSLDEALALRADPDLYATPLAGGQSLVPLLNLRLSTPELLIDLNEVHSLAYIRETEECLSVGAMTRQRELETNAIARARLPFVPHVMGHIGHVTNRNRGTVGGSLAHADPSAELPALMLLLGADLVASSLRGERRMAAADFFTGYLTTCLAEDELLTEVRLPWLANGTRFGIAEFTRRSGDFAIAGVVCSVRPGDDGLVEECRIVAYGAGPVPVRLGAAEQALVGRRLDRETVTGAAASGARQLSPASDLHGSTEYKRQLLTVMCRRALESAAGGSRGDSNG